MSPPGLFGKKRLVSVGSNSKMEVGCMASWRGECCWPGVCGDYRPRGSFCSCIIWETVEEGLWALHPAKCQCSFLSRFLVLGMPGRGMTQTKSIPEEQSKAGHTVWIAEVLDMGSLG